MKHLLSLLLAAVSVIGFSISAGTIQFNVNDFTPIAAANNQEYTISKAGIDITVSDGCIDGQFRIYKYQTMTVTSTVGNITGIQFTCTTNDTEKFGPGNFTATSGEYTYSGNVGTWTGSSSNVYLTATGSQVRATDIVVTTSGDVTTNLSGDPLYILGDVDGSEWNCSGAGLRLSETAYHVYTGRFTINAAFCFISNNYCLTWFELLDYRYGPSTNDKPVSPSIVYSVYKGIDGTAWQISASGEYDVVVDLNQMTLQVTAVNVTPPLTAPIPSVSPASGTYDGDFIATIQWDDYNNFDAYYQIDGSYATGQGGYVEIPIRGEGSHQLDVVTYDKASSTVQSDVITRYYTISPALSGAPLYILGEVEGSSWAYAGAGLQLEETAYHIYQGTFDINHAFCFITKNNCSSWDELNGNLGTGYRYGPSSDGTIASLSNPNQLYPSKNSDGTAWYIEEANTYTVTVDMNTMSMTLTKESSQEESGLKYRIVNGEAYVVYDAGYSSRKSFAIPEATTVDGIEYNVVGIDDGAFANIDNDAFTEVNIPASVRTIGDGAFAGNPSLKSVVVDPANNYYCSDNGALYNKSKSIFIFMPQGSPSLRVELPEGVVEIYTGAFENCANLTSVTIPSTVEYIDARAFQRCISIKRITLPSSLKSIGSAAFSGCYQLNSVMCVLVEPLQVASSVFLGVNTTNAQLIVPRNSTSKYKQAAVWKDFGIIEEMKQGDINGDESIDSGDVSIVLELILNGDSGNGTSRIADMNEDQCLDSGDLSILLELVLNGVNEAITAPASVDVYTDSPNSITVLWNSVAGAEEYNVYRSVDNFNFTLIAEGVTNMFYVDDAPALGYNYYRITAVKGFYESKPSATTDPIYIEGEIETTSFNPETDIKVVYNVVNTSNPTRIFSNRSDYDLTQYLEALYIDGEKYEGILTPGANFSYKFSATGRHEVILRLKSSCTKIGYWTGWLNGNSDYNGVTESGGYAVELHFPSQITYYNEGTGLEDWYVTDIYSYRKVAATSGFGWIWNSRGDWNSVGMNVSGTKRLHVPKGATGYTSSDIWTTLIDTLGFSIVYDIQ